MTGSIYRPPDVAQRRLLVMRRWPRGVAKSRVDEWLPDLAPSVELLARYREGAVEWEAFETAYLGEIEAQPDLLDGVTALAAGGGVLLLCGSHLAVSPPAARAAADGAARGRVEAGPGRA